LNPCSTNPARPPDRPASDLRAGNGHRGQTGCGERHATAPRTGPHHRWPVTGICFRPIPTSPNNIRARSAERGSILRWQGRRIAHDPKPSRLLLHCGQREGGEAVIQDRAGTHDRRCSKSLTLPAAGQHLRIDDIDWHPHIVGVDLFEHVGELQIPFFPRHITDVRCADNIVHAK
jgi:hypothetical protein